MLQHVTILGAAQGAPMPPPICPAPICPMPTGPPLMGTCPMGTCPNNVPTIGRPHMASGGGPPPECPATMGAPPMGHIILPRMGPIAPIAWL
mmetsp:Transcript_10838/g.35919  ORF Transcript_10838/g.35919 Transcript_10838/m.35919 type:complete len:92 (+) Transcript_10838:119-394(+)